MSNDAITQAKEELIKAAQRLFKFDVMFKGEHANLSAKVGEDKIVMTRGGSISQLNMNSFAVVTLDGEVIEGEMDPTTAEVIQMHTAVYRARDSVKSVIHNHAPNMTVFSVAQEPLPLVYEPLLRFGVTEPVPVVPWAPRGSEASVQGIVKIVREHPGLPAVMLANHGVLAFSSSPAQTAQLIATLDEAAELTLKAAPIGGAKSLAPEAVDQVRSRMEQFGSKVMA